MVVNNFTTTQNAAWIPQIVANEALGYLPAFLNLGKTVAKDSELTNQNVGDTINVPKRGALIANQKAQTGSVTRQNPTATTIPVVLDQHWEVTFSEESRAKALQQGGSVIPGYIVDAVAVLAEKIEAKIALLYPSMVSVVTSSKPTTLANISKVREIMTLNKVPMLAQRFGYLHPTVITDLLAVGAFNNPQFVGNNIPLMEGAIGRLYGFDIFEGQLVQQSGSPVAYHSLFYNHNAFVLATRPMELPDSSLGVQSASVQSDVGISLRVIRSFDHETLATLVTLDVLFGTAILDSRMSCEFESF